MRHVHSNGIMMVGSDHNKTKTKTSASGNMRRSNSRSGRTSPGLNVKRFTIPKKQKELLNEVELDSSEYLREVLPIIQQGYRDSSSKNKFNYEKVQLVHNPELKKEFMEKKREMKDAGRNEKELMESYAFLCVDSEEKAKKLSQESLYAGTKERFKLHCLGSPTMGVHVCRYSDVLHRSGVPKEGMLVLFKILKGKVKAVPLVYGAAEILEPTPNYDCHVAKNSGEELPSSASHRLFDSSELFIYDFDEDEVDFRKRPRNICPYAVVYFTYSDSGVASSATSSSNFNRTPVASSNESTPTRNISIPDTVGIAVVAPCFPREDVVTQRPMSDADRPFFDKYREYSERSYRVWSGQLHNKNGNSCKVSLVSFGLSFLPCKMPETLHALKAVRIRELRLPTKVFTGTVPILSRVKEAQANGKYYWYAELHSLSLDDAVYSRFLNYLSEKELVLKKDLGDKVLLYILPTGKTTQNLGLTTSSHPKIMHCLVESYVPMISHLTDVTVKQPRHQVKPDLESAPIHDIDKDHLKRLRFQSSLAKLFYEQNRDLKDMGVKGDAEDVPVPVTLPRQASVEQLAVEQSTVEQSPVEQSAVEQSAVEQSAIEQSAVEHEEPVVAVAESPASPDAPVDRTLSAFVPESRQLKSHQSNQRTAFSSNPEVSPVDNKHIEHPAVRHDWNNYSHDLRHEHPHGMPLWDHSHSQSIQLKEQSRHWAETQPSRTNQEPHQNPHKQSQPVGEASNHHVIQQSPLSSPRSSHPAEHHRLGHQPYEHQSGRTEHRKGYQPYERQSSKEWAPPNASPRGSESRTHQGLHHHHDKHPPDPPGNIQYKRQSSSEWTDQQPSAKQRPNQDRRPQEGRSQEAPKGDLPPQIKEVASKVHNMLTGGIDLGLGLQGPASDANLQRQREETDDEKIARMRATLQALVEERERLAKSNTDKNSANPPTSVPLKSDEVLSSPSTNSDTISESKHPPPDKPKESIVEEPKKSVEVVKPKEMAVTAGNGNEADVRVEGKEGVDKVKEKAVDKVEGDREEDAIKKGKKEEKIVQETGIKRKLEELEGPVTKKMRVDVPKPEVEKGKDPVPKDQAVVPKGVVQKSVAIDEGKTISKPISRTDDSRDQQPKGNSKQESISAKEPDQKQKVPMTKTKEDPKKASSSEKKAKSDVEKKNKVSKKGEGGEKSGKVSKEITSASQMREYLERRHSSSSSEKKGSKEHISSASEMRMFLENPDKVSSKPKRIKSASEMRQFLNKSFTKDKSSKVTGSEEQKGRLSAASDNRQYRELEGKSRDDLLKNHDNDLASSSLGNFLSVHHQITWTLAQGVRVTVKREMAGARLGPPPPGSSRNEDEDFTSSSITAVCHGSYRSMNGTHPDISTKEGLAYQIRQVIHHGQPVKKVEPRKVKEIQKSGDQRKLSSSQDSTESREAGGRVESPADIPDGACFLGDLDNEEEEKKKGNSKSTFKKQPGNPKLTSQVKKKSVSKVEAPSHAVESKKMSVKVPRKSIKLKIKRTEKSYTTTIPSTGEDVEKGKATTQARQVINKTRDPAQKNKNKDNTMTGTGQSSRPSTLVGQQAEAQLQKKPFADVDRSAHLDQATCKVNVHSTMETAISTRSACQPGRNTISKENVHQDNIKVPLPPVDMIGAVRDLVKCLSADEIRQLIRVYDEVFSRRQDTRENQLVPRDKEGPDALQLSVVDLQPSGDTRQSGMLKEDQDEKEKEEVVVPSDKSLSKICSDKTEVIPDGSLQSFKKGEDECQKDDVQQVGEDYPPQKKLDVEQSVADTKQLAESLLTKQSVPFLQKVEIVQAIDIRPLGEDHPQELSIPSLNLEEREKPADNIKPTEDEDTLPYPLETNQEGTSGTDQGATSSSDMKVPIQNEACIDLYDSERWSELDEDVQTDASKEYTFSGSAEQSGKRQLVDNATTSLETAVKPDKDNADVTTVSVASDTSGVTSSDVMTKGEGLEHGELLSILSRELKSKPPINKQTDIRKQTDMEQVEESRASVFDRLSAIQPKTRNVVVDDKGAVYPGMSLESSEYPEENEDKVKKNNIPQPSSSLPAFLEASQSRPSDSENKSTEHEEKSTRVSVFDRLYSKQPDQEPQKKRVSVFDRLYVPKPDKPEPTQTDSSKLERVSAFDRLSARKVTKTSAQEKEKEKKNTPSGSSSSKVQKEKTVKAVLSSKVNKIDSGKATNASSVISSKVLAVKPKKADEVVPKERQTSSKNVSKHVLKSKKRELPREDVSANKKYRLATKDQVDKKDKYKEQQKENVKSDKEDKLRRKDPVEKRGEKYRDPPRESVPSSYKHKQLTKSHGKKEETDRNLQRERHTTSRKPKEVTKDQSGREEKYMDKRSEKRLDERSDKKLDQRDVSRKQDVKKGREYRRQDSKGQDSDRSSVSTIEDSDSVRQNILKRANNSASDFSKYVVSGRYLKLEGKKSPSPRLDPDNCEATSTDSTIKAELDKGHSTIKDRETVNDYSPKEQPKYDSKATTPTISNNGETQPVSVQESYPILDTQIHTISVIGGSISNSMHSFHERHVGSVAIPNGLPDDLPLDKVSAIGNRGDNRGEQIQNKITGEPYDSESPECPTTLSPETQRAFEQALKASIGSPTKQDYHPESPTDNIRSVQSCHQDEPFITSAIPAPGSGNNECSSTFTQSTFKRDEPSQEHADSRKIKTSLKAPSSRQVHFGNRFHPYDKRVKTFQGHCHSLREPATAELISNFCKEEFRLRKMQSASRLSALSREEAFFDQARLSPSRFGSLNQKSHDEGTIQRAEEVEMTHSREGAGDAVTSQRGAQLEILDRQIESLTASGSDIQDYFILDSNVYPLKNGDDSALSGVPPRMRARRGRGRPPPPRHREPPHPYQIRAHFQGQPNASRGYPHGHWNEPNHRVWNGPSQRSFERWDRSPRYPSPSKFHYRKGH